MARMPFSDPWYRASRRGWFTTMDDGKQVPLGVTDPAAEGAAWAALQKLMADVSEVKAAVAGGPKVRAGTVPELVGQFLAEKAATVQASTVKGYRKYLDWLAAKFPGPAAGVDLAAVVAAAAAEPRWGDTHRANVLWTVGAFLRWCGRPDARPPLPPKESRGADAVVSEATYRRCLTESRGDFQQLIRFLWHTGCRPGEATGLTAEAVDWSAGTITLKKHKTKHKGKKRVLYLGSDALAVLQEQRERHPAGLLFRGQRGEQLSLQAMTMRFERLSEKVGVRVTSYMFRHTWATRALSEGIPDAQVAAMLGHTSTAMIHKHYSHLTSNAKLLKEVAERVSRTRAG